MTDHLTDLEQLLLLAAVRIGDGAYAGAMREDILENTGREVSLGSIYVTMMRLEEQGLVDSSLGDATATRGGKAKRLYRVTAEGRRSLEATRAAFDRMWAGVDDRTPEGA